MSGPRIVVFAYSEVGYECLRLLIERGDNVVALVTHEDNPNENIWFKTPALAAREAGIPVHTPAGVNTPEWIERIASWKPDLILSFYYRHMISTKVLALAPLGAFNMHGSLLPKFRGRAPLNWAIVKGATESGMTLHRMVKSADAGAIVDQEGIAVDDRDTAEQLFRKVLPLARAVLARQIDALLAGRAPEREQDHSQATYFGARTPADGLVDWTLPVQDIYNLVRGVTDPFPGAFAFRGGDKLMIWWVEKVAVAPRGPAGSIVSLDPLRVAAVDGELELTRWNWAAPSASLEVGQMLGKP